MRQHVPAAPLIGIPAIMVHRVVIWEISVLHTIVVIVRVQEGAMGLNVGAVKAGYFKVQVHHVSAFKKMAMVIEVPRTMITTYALTVVVSHAEEVVEADAL